MTDAPGTVAKLMNTLPQSGRVEWIGLSPGRRKPIVEVDEVPAEVGTGLVGDRHSKSGKSKRQVTLIQAEHLPLLGQFMGEGPVDPKRLRRNLVVSGVNLIALKNKRFRVGEAVLEGTKPCDPCSRMEEELGPGGYNNMRGHGGLCAVVIEAGTIRVGDELHFLGDPPVTS